MKNFIKYAILFVVALSMILYALTDSIDKITKYKDYYYTYSRQENIKEYAGVSQEDLDENYSSLIDYIYSDNNKSLIDDKFNQKEVDHMVDVNNLFRMNSSIKSVSLIIGLGFYLYTLLRLPKVKNRDISILIGCLLAILILESIIIALFAMDFNAYFIKFHELFFDNELWLLDPRTDLMIRMLPEHYFMSLAARIALSFARKMGLVFIILFALKYTLKRRTNV